MSAGQGQIERSANVVWEGGLADGAGRIDGPDGEATALSWAGRTAPGAPPQTGVTSPEELIAAAHAGCYSMSLANVLGQAGHTPDRLDVQARCVAGLTAAGLGIQAITLQVRGAIPGLDAGEFTRLADEAERQCPVSNSLRGNVDIRVDAQLVAA